MFLTESSVVTQASPETVWKLWADVANWNHWDEGIEVSLEGPFTVGTKGILTPTGAPGLPYLITEATPLQSFSDTTLLPGAELRGTHHLEVTPAGTQITHRVEISGPAWQEYAEGLGKELEQDLPKTVAKLARLAEQIEVQA